MAAARSAALLWCGALFLSLCPQNEPTGHAGHPREVPTQLEGQVRLGGENSPKVSGFTPRHVVWDPKFGSRGNASNKASRHPHLLLEVQEPRAGLVWDPWSRDMIPREAQQLQEHTAPRQASSPPWAGSCWQWELCRGLERELSPLLPNPASRERG